MGFNYAAEKKKFETLWARLRCEYRAAGMSDTAIQKMHDFDWEVFKQERIYRLHTQDLGIGTDTQEEMIRGIQQQIRACVPDLDERVRQQENAQERASQEQTM